MEDIDASLWKISKRLLITEPASVFIAPFKSSTLILNSWKKKFKGEKKLERDRSYSENDIQEIKNLTSSTSLIKINSQTSLSTASSLSNENSPE
jgi:hypothetical protein